MTAVARRRTVVAGDGLLHPIAIAALVILVANDHFLKAAWPGVVTGKLSDVAGLVLAPLTLQAGAELVAAARRRAWRPTRITVAASTAVIGVGFVAAKTLEPAADLYRGGMALLQWPFATVASLISSGAVVEPSPVLFVRDPGDLVTLPSLAIPLFVGYRRVDHAQADRADHHRGHHESGEDTQLDADREEAALTLGKDGGPQAEGSNQRHGVGDEDVPH